MTESTQTLQNSTILVINPGSTSTKVALFAGEKLTHSSTLSHSPESLGSFSRIVDQIEFREAAIRDFISQTGIDLDRLDAVAGRGGLLKPMPGGTYRVSTELLEDLRAAAYGEHASNLGAMLAHKIGSELQIPAYIVDPVTTDEFELPARISGVPGIERRCRNHTLNIKAVARRAAAGINKPLDATNFVVAHMGGGVSVCALKSGRIIDSTDGMLGEGPFSLDRAGTVASERIIEMCFDQGRSREEVVRMLGRESGFKGYLGETELPLIQQKIDSGDSLAAGVMAAFIQQVSKWIGAMVAVLQGRLDAIIITGGMANSAVLVQGIASHVETLAPLTALPGELEMEALAEGTLRVLTGREEALSYQG